MSKVEIDTSEVSLEEQIKAATAFYYSNEDGCLERDRPIAFLLAEFAAGKFSKQPLPEIVKPKWCVLATITTAGPYFHVEAYASGDPGMRAVVHGPTKESAFKAITAFNELFGSP
jgi:hypothetical protein